MDVNESRICGIRYQPGRAISADSYVRPAPGQAARSCGRARVNWRRIKRNTCCESPKSRIPPTGWAQPNIPGTAMQWDSAFGRSRSSYVRHASPHERGWEMSGRCGDDSCSNEPILRSLMDEGILCRYRVTFTDVSAVDS